jgi:sec-independent protein translocase protein TatB
MIDFGFDKIALIGAVALIVIGPERLPKVARVVGHMLGKAQRYVADVKAEVNRSIELDELKKMKTQFEDAARDVHSSVSKEMNEARSGLDNSIADASSSYASLGNDAPPASAWLHTPMPAYKPVKKNWRAKRSALPQWFKQRTGVRMHAQSGAARVARFRPPKTPHRMPRP